MSNIPVGINQGDYIYYYDLSLGNIVSRNWYFPGGTPTGSTQFGPVVRYTSPNLSGFGASLTVTDNFGVAGTTSDSGIIVVYPEITNFGILITKNGSPITSSEMSSDVTFTATGSTGSGISYYTWNLPGITGFTGSSNTFTTNLYDWLQLTGSEFGASYQTYVTAGQVTAVTNLGNSFTASSSITYNKSGVPEFLNLCNYPSATGPTAHNINYFSTTVYPPPLTTNSILMSGNGLLIGIDSVGTAIFNNSSFHAQGESMGYYSSSLDIQNVPILGQVISSYYAFDTMGVSGGILSNTSSLTRYTQGGYMYPGDIKNYLGNSFYFADTNNQLIDLTSTIGRGWSLSSVKTMLDDTSFASRSSRFCEIYGDFPIGYVLGILVDNLQDVPCGPLLPTYSVMSPPSNVILYFDVYCSPSRNYTSPVLAGTVTVSISTLANNNDNSPNGSYILCQDTSYGSQLGIASRINLALASSNLSPYMGATAGTSYLSYETDPSRSTSSLFSGLSVSILDDFITSSKGSLPLGITGDTYIVRVDMRDNHASWDNPMYSAADYLGMSRTSSAPNSTISIYNPYQSSNPTTPRRGWIFNG